MNTRQALASPRGFTLIELLIAVAIVGITAALAVPSYTSYMQQTRRTDATIFLVEAAGEQVRFFSENNRYAGDLAELGYDDATVKTPEGLYEVIVDSTGPTGFVLQATPVAAGVQQNDAGCTTLTIDAKDLRLPTECW